MKTVREVSELTGVSIRTLHYYDAIGLLKPSAVTEAGYRLYDDGSLRRLQSILLFRELRFPLKEIREILDRPDLDQDAALEDQIRLLRLQRERLDRIIALACDIRKKGFTDMSTTSFTAFDRGELDAYEAEAKERWASTAAWQEYAARPKRSPAEQKAVTDVMMDIFRQLGTLRHLSPADERVQALIARLQQHITKNWYTCTSDILKGLGQMYVSDPRMQKNIDKAGGEGTAAFAAEAIAVYTK